MGNRKIILRIVETLLLTVLIVIAWNGERLPKIVGQGMGWDGATYGQQVADFETLFSDKKVTQYRFQRLLPVAATHYFLKLTGKNFEPDNIVWGFKCINTLLIFLGLGLFLWFVHKRQWKEHQEFIAFCLIFLNYPIIKFSIYYPVLTDVGAWFFGLLIAILWMIGLKIALGISILAGSFTFPSIMQSSLPLLVFNRTRIATDGPMQKMSTLVIKYGKWVLTILFAIFVIQNYMLDAEGNFPWASRFTNKINQSLVIFSIPLAIAYFYFYFSKLVSDRINIKKAALQFSVVGLATAIIIYIIQHWILDTYATSAGYSLMNYLRNVVIFAIINPLNFLVAHSTYFGLLILMIFFFFKDFTTEVKNHGPGALRPPKGYSRRHSLHLRPSRKGRREIST